MIYYNTLGNNLKRGLLRFTEKISKGYSKPQKKFISDMVFGIISANSCKLTEIGRALKENISLKKTVDRLGRNLANFSDKDKLMSNYLKTIQPSLGDHAMLLIDGGDATKPCSPKMESIGYVYDASTKKYKPGYWTMGAVALTENNHQPIPVYENLYPCKKQGGNGVNAEIKAVLQNLRNNFGKNIPRVFDRGFDSGQTICDLILNEEKFILRQNQNRVAVHKGKREYIDDVVRGLVCTHEVDFYDKTGKTSKCKLGMTRITLPNMQNLKLNLVVCKEFGEDPLVLYTNLDESSEMIAECVVKAYLMRWRIEEFYAFKKQKLKFEDFRVRSLDSIQTLDILLTVAAGYIGMLCDKVNEEKFVSELIIVSKRIQKLNHFIKQTKFLYYAVLTGITCVFAYLKDGIPRSCSSNPPLSQLPLPGF